jgi:hypothetical protein
VSAAIWVAGVQFAGERSKFKVIKRNVSDATLRPWLTKLSAREAARRFSKPQNSLIVSG